MSARRRNSPWSGSMAHCWRRCRRSSPITCLTSRRNRSCSTADRACGRPRSRDNAWNMAKTASPICPAALPGGKRTAKATWAPILQPVPRRKCASRPEAQASAKKPAPQTGPGFFSTGQIARSAARIVVILIVVVIVMGAVRKVEEAVRVGVIAVALLLFFRTTRQAEGFQPLDGAWQARFGIHFKALLGRDQLAALVVGHHRFLLFRSLGNGRVEFGLLAQAKGHRIDRLDVVDVPVRPIADRLDGRLGRADKLGDLAIAEFRMEFDQPVDRRRAVLTLGQRHVARTTALFLALRGGIDL